MENKLENIFQVRQNLVSMCRETLRDWVKLQGSPFVTSDIYLDPEMSTYFAVGIEMNMAIHDALLQLGCVVIGRSDIGENIYEC